jgi:hypothetical protein
MAANGLADGPKLRVTSVHEAHEDAGVRKDEH